MATGTVGAAPNYSAGWSSRRTSVEAEIAAAGWEGTGVSQPAGAVRAKSAAAPAGVSKGHAVADYTLAARTSVAPETRQRLIGNALRGKDKCQTFTMVEAGQMQSRSNAASPFTTHLVSP